jgi:gag-polypeptide of LTR copia-type/Domain of unknown function (DUF4219)
MSPCFSLCAVASLHNMRLTRFSLQLNMSSSLEKLVPLLDGSNYLVWAEAMKSYLRSMGVWQIVVGNQRQPTIPMQTAQNTAEVAVATVLKNKWDNDDDAALGSMLLRVSTSLHHHIGQNVTSNGAWTRFQTLFGTQGPSLIFVDFRSTITAKLPAQNPELEIRKMASIFACLAMSNCTIPNIVQAMILLAAMPREFEQLGATILQTTTAANLTFDVVRTAIIAESQ